jgi:hypothetical protein
MTEGMSYIKRNMQLGVAMLQGSATWKTLCNNLPREKLIFYTGGDIEKVGRNKQFENIDGLLVSDTPPIALISQMPFKSEALAAGVFKRNGTIKIRIILSPPAGTIGPKAIDYGLENVGNICEEINAQFGQTGKIGNGCAHVEIEELPEPTGALAGFFVAIINLDWSTS